MRFIIRVVTAQSNLKFLLQCKIMYVWMVLKYTRGNSGDTLDDVAVYTVIIHMSFELTSSLLVGWNGAHADDTTNTNGTHVNQTELTRSQLAT